MKIFVKLILGFILFYAALLMAKKKLGSVYSQKGPKQKWILGHRGARANAPENTLSAFQKAMEYGADGVEFDVFLSKDAVPVVIHDETVDRTTDGHGPVQDFSASELGKLNAAKSFAEFSHEGVPTLEQALSILPQGAIVNVELKGGGHFTKQKFVDCVLLVLQKYERHLTLIISSFDGELLYLFRLSAPHYLVSLLLSPFDENWPKVLRHIDAIKPDALHLPAAIANSFVINLAKRHQMRVAIWTVNNTDEAKAWFQKGVAGIVTDTVPEMVAALPKNLLQS